MTSATGWARGVVGTAVVLAVAVGVARTRAAGPEDWSRFRGPNGSGVSETAGLPLTFGPEENVIWKTELPFGHSSPILTGDRIYLTAVREGRRVTIALDRPSGACAPRSRTPAPPCWRRSPDIHAHAVGAPLALRSVHGRVQDPYTVRASARRPPRRRPDDHARHRARQELRSVEGRLGHPGGDHHGRGDLTLSGRPLRRPLQPQLLPTSNRDAMTAAGGRS